MKKVSYFLIFLVLNFGALGIGSWLMNSGPTSDWYMALHKAPWTPPGWVFGAAWTTIMVCFSFYMVALVQKNKAQLLLILFFIQWCLNVSWNWVFFNKHQMLLSEFILLALTGIVGFFMFKYRKQMRYLNLLILPYFLWLLIANSLNIFAIFKNPLM
jgi:tryptophan-rich sensory protein